MARKREDETMKETIKEIYNTLAQEKGPSRARELLVALVPEADVDSALVEPEAADLLAELCTLAEAANTGAGESRRESIRIAIEAGTERATLVKIAEATRVSRKATVVLPKGRYEHLSRGKGWARKGKGDSAEWGEKTDNGYRVGPGRWTVGSSDGFKRKSSDDWNVAHVTVGDNTWTIAS